MVQCFPPQDAQLKCCCDALQEQTPALNGSCGAVDSFNGLMSGVVFDAPNGTCLAPLLLCFLAM